MPVTEILFGDEDGLRIGTSGSETVEGGGSETVSVGGAVVIITTTTPGDGVVEVTPVVLVGGGGGDILSLVATADGGGFDFGYGPTFPGSSLTPDVFNGQTINGISGQPLFDQTVIVLDGLLAQDFFTSITVDGVTKLSADAVWTQFASTTQWEWIADAPSIIPGAGTYDFEIA